MKLEPKKKKNFIKSFVEVIIIIITDEYTWRYCQNKTNIKVLCVIHRCYSHGGFN